MRERRVDNVLVDATERMMRILWHVGRRPGVALDAEKIRADMGVYEGETGRRKWREDTSRLRRRGWLETDLTTETTPNRRGIRLREGPIKARRLELTPDEHFALQCARQLVRADLEPGPMISDADDRDGLALTMVLLRILEEADEPVALVDLAAKVKQPPARVWRILSYVQDGMPDHAEALHLEYADEGEDGDPLPEAISVIRRFAAQDISPTHGTALASLGRFAYTPRETRERLLLIAGALDRDDLPPEIRSCLESARSKLSNWLKCLEPIS